jgi:preprotein translocase subunit SecA
MALKFIAEKELEERKREKRLVHLTNELGREFVESLKLKAKTDKENAGFIAKSFLDYVFFDQRKEIAEIHADQVEHFLLEYAPRKLNLTRELAQETPAVVEKLIVFLENNGYLKNTDPLRERIRKQSKPFAKLVAAIKKSPARKVKPDEGSDKKTAIGSEKRVGRNDPCPCGSGKKYKKCCGREA